MYFCPDGSAKPKGGYFEIVHLQKSLHRLARRILHTHMNLLVIRTAAKATPSFLMITKWHGSEIACNMHHYGEFQSSEGRQSWFETKELGSA